MTPSSFPLSITAVIPSFLDVISTIASRILASGVIFGNSSPIFIRSPTRVSNRLPREPPGCDLAKSVSVKPLARNNAIASASPRARVAVVLDVGANPSGQAS